MPNDVTLKRVRYTHDAMIDLMVAQPGISQNQLAAEFGYTPAWVSIVVNSDAFQLRLSERKAELIDPILRASIEDRLRAATSDALEFLTEKIAMGGVTVEEATKIVAVGSRALGYGVRQPDQKVALTQYVAFLPPQAGNATDWAAAHRPQSTETLEMEAVEVMAARPTAKPNAD